MPPSLPPQSPPPSPSLFFTIPLSLSTLPFNSSSFPPSLSFPLSPSPPALCRVFNKALLTQEGLFFFYSLFFLPLSIKSQAATQSKTAKRSCALLAPYSQISSSSCPPFVISFYCTPLPLRCHLPRLLQRIGIISSGRVRDGAGRLRRSAV